MGSPGSGARAMAKGTGDERGGGRDGGPGGGVDDARARRLKAALKSNMARRKAQAKDRDAEPNHRGRARAGREGDDG